MSKLESKIKAILNSLPNKYNLGDSLEEERFKGFLDRGDFNSKFKSFLDRGDYSPL